VHDDSRQLNQRIKRQKKEVAALSQVSQQDKALNTIADEVVCPITRQLLVDPVMARDGKVYERGSIETWLKKHERSPMNGNHMEATLVPALHVRNIIEALIASDAIDADMAKMWVERSEKEAKHKALLALAKQIPPWSRCHRGSCTVLSCRGRCSYK
jgi:hypothetical protein